MCSCADFFTFWQKKIYFFFNRKTFALFLWAKKFTFFFIDACLFYSTIKHLTGILNKTPKDLLVPWGQTEGLQFEAQSWRRIAPFVDLFSRLSVFPSILRSSVHPSSGRETGDSWYGGWPVGWEQTSPRERGVQHAGSVCGSRERVSKRIIRCSLSCLHKLGYIWKLLSCMNCRWNILRITDFDFKSFFKLSSRFLLVNFWVFHVSLSHTPTYLLYLTITFLCSEISNF